MSKISSIRCLITAGPTREFLDPVRFISNPSTGKMGYALAKAAVKLGWSVDLVTGPVSLEDPLGCVMYPVVSADEMFNQVDALFEACDILIMAAAVSDYRPIAVSSKKIKKDKKNESIELIKTDDILLKISERKKSQFIVGFAAETENLEENAKEKLRKKSCDWIIANKVSFQELGFAGDENKIKIYNNNGLLESYETDDKNIISQKIIDKLDQELST